MPLGRLSTATRTVRAPVGTTFAALTDLRRHGEAFPLTTVAAPAGPARVGDHYEAVTAGFVRDGMVLEELRGSPAGSRRAVYRKVDGVFRGPVTLTARAVPGGTRVTWSYDVVLARGPRALTRVPATIACGLVARLALWRLAGLVEADVRPD